MKKTDRGSAAKGRKDDRRQSKAAPEAGESARPTVAGASNGAGGADFPVVGVGASAGGLEAFSELLAALPCDTGMAFVLVQHLDPSHESALTEILARKTAMPVREVRDEMAVEPDCVYVIPPNRDLAIANGVLKPTARDRSGGKSRSIDFFLESLAGDRGGRAIGVILSGTASDGTKGIEAIKAEGGMAFAQDGSAKYDSMPRSAIEAGCVDFVLPPAQIAAELARIATHPYLARDLSRAAPDRKLEADRSATGAAAPVDSGWQKDLRRILVRLRDSHGVDFSQYKPSTIERRILRRMALHRSETLKDYADYLRKAPEELDLLYTDILIGVTGFFRDPEAFEILKRKVFPALKRQEADDPLRFWVAGCSTGQEAYSLVMAFSEYCEGADRAPKLQIFATDLNDDLLEKARAGIYAKSLVNDVSPERLRRFFVEENDSFRVKKNLRESIVFARHNIVGDPPFSRMDIVCCRNLMIYLEASLQQRLLSLLHYALKPEGFLFLGASESAGSYTEFFEPIDKKWKIFRRNALNAPSVPVRFSSGRPAGESSEDPTRSQPESAEPGAAAPNAHREADRITVNRFAPPSVLIDANYQILQFRGSTGAYLEPPTGKATFHLLKMARRGLMTPLRSAVEVAKKGGREVRREGVPVQNDGTGRTVTIEVIPLKNLADRCFLVFFREERAASLHAPSAAPSAFDESRAVADLERELTETRDYLQSLQEQYEASSEELQASNEEIQSANEELQSINEELETSKEELESTNEELTTVNDEMTNRNAELNRLNADLLNLQNSVNNSIVLLTRNLTVRRFTPRAEKTFNLLPGDIGRSTIGRVNVNFDFPELEEWAREVVATAAPREKEVQDKAGRWYSLRARPYLTADNEIDGAVLMLVDIDSLKQSHLELKNAHEFANAIVSQVSPLLILDDQLRVVQANESFLSHFQVSPEDTEGNLVYDLGNGEWNIPELKNALEKILPELQTIDRFEMEHEFNRIGRRTLVLGAQRLDHLQKILLRIDDITEQRKAERKLIELNQTLEDRVSERTAEIGRRADQLQSISLELADTEHRERRRLALVLHDDLQQLLVGALMHARSAYGSKGTPERGEYVCELLSQAIETTRTLSKELAPSVLYEEGLGAALHWLAGWSQERYDLRVEVKADPAGDPPNRQLRVVLFEEVRELILNVVKHGKTDFARVSLDRVDDALRLEVEDFGAGFDPATLDEAGDEIGFGLHSIKERLQALGGEMKIDSVPGRGTRVALLLPIEKTNASPK